jgi:hypothetical protein
MATNLQLKISILQSPWTAKIIAESAGLTPGRLSKIVGGYSRPTKSEKTRIASILQRPEMALFGDEGESDGTSGEVGKGEA